MSDAAHRLVALLREAKATPRLNADAVAPSAVYDAGYRAAVIAMTLRTCGTVLESGQLSLADPKLKLFQFIAVHRHLLEPLRAWIAMHQHGSGPSLDGWRMFPRGYASDSIYERLTVYLAASGNVRRVGTNIVARADAGSVLGKLLSVVEREQAFQDEQAVLTELASMRVTLRMLRA